MFKPSSGPFFRECLTVTFTRCTLWVGALCVAGWTSYLAGAVAGQPSQQGANSPRRVSVVKAWIKSGKPEEKVVRALAELPSFAPKSALSLSRFGGILEEDSREASGFFRTEKIGPRWWLIDPEGHRFLHVAVCSVKPGRGPTFRKAFAEHFRDESDWAQKTGQLLREHGFNGTGAWTDNRLLEAAEPRPVYTRILNFMSTFGRKLGVVTQTAGHKAYPDQLIPVFHPDFPAHCRQVAQQLRTTKDDPYLLGVFSDNEMQHNRQALDLHLRFPPDSPERKAALAWLKKESIETDNITAEDRLAYVAHMFETYFAIVRQAIHEVDSNHLYLGSRLHGWDKNNPYLFAAAGRHLDVVAVNVYGTWTPAESVERWVEWGGKPVIITEFYAKGQDSGLPNLSGAGWTVPTQRDRGRFYQHFTLSLLESRGCVGWHYFKYVDNDLLDLTTDPSNRDSNKGILSSGYKPWEEFLEAIKVLNRQVYPLVAYFDAK